ncbi:MAG: hypothetical protein AAGC68_02800 [Verrucomicrobiota bacterium]
MIRAFDKWLVPWLLRRVPRVEGPRHVFLAVCDHFEPLHASDKAGAIDRIGTWQERFPALIKPFRDVDGEPPKHTFFYPIEQYDPDLLSPIADLCHETGSEVEVHLHHENDTPENVRETLEQGKEDLGRHGLLSRDESGAVRYGFIHGNWALNNCHPQGLGCGVSREIPILRSTGCYADFTMPSAPSPTQCRVVNQIGYLSDFAGAEALNRLDPVREGEGVTRREDESKLLMIQGPLALNWGWRKWGLIPRMENGDITGANPPTSQRLNLAVGQGVSVERRADWIFVKLHTHGGIESNFGMLLGEPMRRFHEALSGLTELKLHYVTAREMANLVHAAEDGRDGEPAEYRDYLFRM